MTGGPISEANIYGLTIRESATDGSDFTNPDADYRRLFLGEDGLLHVKDSAGAVTDPSTGAAEASPPMRSGTRRATCRRHRREHRGEAHRRRERDAARGGVRRGHGDQVELPAGLRISTTSRGHGARHITATSEVARRPR